MKTKHSQMTKYSCSSGEEDYGTDARNVPVVPGVPVKKYIHLKGLLYI